ncbi:MAG TPA: hypothetical protein VF435_04510, partial [Pyrinomonadaceae bacterium]
HLKVIVGYVKVLFGLRRLNPPRQTAPTEEETSFSFKNLQSAEQAFQVFNSPGKYPAPAFNKESHNGRHTNPVA